MCVREIQIGKIDLISRRYQIMVVSMLKNWGCVKPEKNSIFLKKGKTVISVENRKFSRSRMMKRTVPLNSSREI